MSVLPAQERAELAPGPSAPREARAVVARVLEDAGVRDPHVVRLAALLTSELVTNAVRHGRGGVALEVSASDGSLEVSASDHSHDLPVLRHPDLSDQGGRGVALIDSLAAAWGVRPGGDGKAVWFRLDVPAAQEG